MSGLKLSAVTIPAMHATVFVVNLRRETIPESIDRSDWTIEEDVQLRVPDDLHAWPDGAEAPEIAILCKSRADLKRYEVFKRAKDVDVTRFQSTPMTYGGLYTESQWENLIRNFFQFSEFLRISDAELPEVAANVRPTMDWGY